MARGLPSIPHHAPKVSQIGAEPTNNPPVPLPALSLDLNPHFSYSGLLTSQFLIQISLPQDASFDLPCPETSSLKKKKTKKFLWGGQECGRGGMNHLCLFSLGVLSTAVQLTLLWHSLHSGP